MDTSKIIKGVVNSGRYTVTAPIIKEDYGLYLQIEGVELPSTYEVDFSNSENSGTSVTMIGNADGVRIPSQFISTGKDVFAFLYHVGEDFGRTIYKFRIPNKVRPDRTSEQPTPEEQSLIDQAIGALNTAVEQTAQDVESAEQAKDDAESARDNAQTYANNAQTSATQASASASQASTSATASAQSASQSAQIKTDVEGMVDDAQASASASAQSASASANSASQAQGFANSASASAQSASTSASDALTYTNTASSKASEASTSAQTASTKATEASQSASQALAYKTDAESAKTASQTAQGLAESARDTAVSAKDDAESARDDAVQAKEDAESAVASISGALADKAPVITDTASGSIASFSDGADDLPLKSLVVDINPVQDLHGYDSPWPAGGGKNLWRADNYLVPLGSANPVTLNGDEYTMTWSNGAIAFYVNQRQMYPAGTYVVSGVGTNIDKVRAFFYNEQGATLDSRYLNNNSSVTLQEPFYIGVGGNYASPDTAVFKAQLELGSTPTAWSPYENICPISGWTEVETTQAGSNLWNPVPDGMAKWNPSIGEQIPSITTNFTTFANDVLAVNTTWSWNGNAFTTNKLLTGRTYRVTGVVNSNSNCARIGVYTLDANRRVVRIARYVTDNGNMDVSVTMGASDVYICVSVANATDNEAVTIANPCISESGVYEPYTGRSITINLGQTVYGGKLDVLTGILTVYPYYDSYNGETLTGEWISDRDKYVAGTTPTIGAQVVNIGAQGVTVQLEPHEVESLYGVNNLWADSGDTEVEYRADTKLFIERLTAPDSADMIADANITSGQYFMVGNTLYKATANIANGAQIIVGTNCIRKSLSEALNEINA